MEILINDLQEEVDFESETLDLIEKIAQQVLEVEDIDKEASIALVGKTAIEELNKKYRGKDEATDVLSFPQEDEELLGDVIVCVPRAVEQADEYNHSLSRELGFLIVHGMLHLSGYEHHQPQEKKIMRAKEEEILAEFNLKRD
ncbi:MAG: rRNA maturation RNase YbeY [Bacillota bacterium]